MLLEDEKKEFFNLISLLGEKIAENTFVSSYYQALKDILIGPKWNNSFIPKNIKSLDIFSKFEKKDVFLTILKFILVLELDQNLEYNFYQAMLYLVYFISKSDISCFNLFYVYLKIKDLRITTIKFIKSLNNQFHSSII